VTLEPDNAVEPSNALAPTRPLWRNWRFQLLWIGSGTGFLGMGVADFAYPLVILSITGAPGLAAAFGFVQIVATVLAGLPAGAFVDRADRRHVLMFTEATRALVAASVFLAAVLGHLTLVHLLVVAAVLGAVSPLAASSRMLVVRAVVPPAQLTAALTQDQVRSSVTGLAGPPLGGVILAAGRALPFLTCAVSFAVSFATALIVRIPPPEPLALSRRNGMFAGVSELWENRMIRSAMTTMCIINIGGNALYLAVVVQLLHHGSSTRSIGIAMAGEAAGNLLGAAFVSTLHRRLGPGTLLLTVSAMLTGGVALLAIPLGAWWASGVLMMAMLGMPSVAVLIDILILRQVPDERRGRTMTAFTTVLTVGIPIGTLVGGLLLQFAGPTVTILAIAAVCAIGLARGVADPHLRQAQWPVDASSDI